MTLNKLTSEMIKSTEDNKQAINYYDLAVSSFYNGDFEKAEHFISKYKSIIKYDSFPRLDKRTLSHPDLSVVIVAYSTGDKLIDCIESLLKNNNVNNYEIIVVDNGGNDDVTKKIAEFDLLYVISPHNFGPSEGRNIGAYFAKGKIIAFLDDDAIVGRDYIKYIIASFNRHQIIGLRGKVLSKTNHFNNKKVGHYDLGNNEKLIRYVNTEGNSAFDKSEYLKLNGMNPLLFGHEGVEFSYRLEKFYKIKKILYSPEIIIYHDYACSDVELDIKEKRHNMMMSYLKYMHGDIDDFITGQNCLNSDKSTSLDISFSIIMPTFNRKYCIKNAIDSLLTQTYQEFELIVIDDGSTDGTDKYVGEIYKKEISNIKIKYFKIPKNRGAAFARNEGLKKAKNKWIGYLDSDNQMRDNFLEVFRHNIEMNQDFEIFYGQINKIQSKEVIGHKFEFDELLQSNYIDIGAFVHSRRIYNELGGFDDKLSRLIDWDIIIKYTEKYPPKFIEKVLLDYDDSSESSRITNTVFLDDEYKKVIINYYNRIPARNFIEKHTGHITHLNQTIFERDKQISCREQSIQSLTQALADRDEQIGKLKHAMVEYEQHIVNLNAERTHILDSTSWKITSPLRIIGQRLKRSRAYVVKRFWTN